MIRVLHGVRVFLSLAVLASSVLFFMPPAVSAVMEEPCEFEEEVGPCTADKAHIYHTTCEGFDCYYELEECCPLPE